MKIVKAPETQITGTMHKLDVYKLYEKDSAQAMYITLQAGQVLKPHLTPVDMFFFVPEGTPEILVGDEKVQVGIDSLVERPKDIVHCLYDNSDKVARIMVVKVPKPTTQAKQL